MPYHVEGSNRADTLQRQPERHRFPVLSSSRRFLSFFLCSFCSENGIWGPKNDSQPTNVSIDATDHTQLKFKQVLYCDYRKTPWHSQPSAYLNRSSKKRTFIQVCQTGKQSPIICLGPFPTLPSLFSDNIQNIFILFWQSIHEKLRTSWPKFGHKGNAKMRASGVIWLQSLLLDPQSAELLPPSCPVHAV